MSRQPYVRPVSRTTWYLRNGRYRIYMLREVTCLLVGFYSALLLCALAALAAGPESWDGFLCLAAERDHDRGARSRPALFPVLPDLRLVQAGAQGHARAAR
ncbi:MAG: hypothetical protein GWM87_04570 [Xanthomonadales bacterium]|nr:hypothetical protein [Xanthomonadales bacterium]NIX12283.1 hypothetical protein [Xanthomonadales bacterium]